MKFYSIRQGLYGDVSERLETLIDACNFWQVEFIDLDASRLDFTGLGYPQEPHLMYRINAGVSAVYLEGLFLGKYTISFYTQPVSFTPFSESAAISLVLEKQGIPSPRTVYSTTSDRALLDSYINYLDGFPIIFKPLTGNKGFGVIKIEGYHTLYPLLEFFEAKNTPGILRKYIPHRSTYRVMVVGDKAICATETMPVGREFRSNIDNNRVDKAIDLNEKIAKLAVDAVKAIHLEFGGVDIITDEEGNYLVLEVNFPSGGLKRISDLCGVNIGQEMIKYLIDKSGI